MVLDQITIENFKGIKEPVNIAFKPITLLFGKNSAGKSSIIHGLDYARQIFVQNDVDPFNLRHERGNLDLGTFENIAYNNDLSHPIIFKYHLSFDEEPFMGFTSPILNIDSNHSLDEEGALLHISKGESQLMMLGNKIKTAVVKIIIKWNERLKKPYITSYQFSANDALLFQIYHADDRDDRTLLSFYENPILPSYVLDAFRKETGTHKILDDGKKFQESKERYDKGEISYHEWEVLKIMENDKKNATIRWIEYKDHAYCNGKELFFEELRQKSDLPDPNGTLLFDSPNGWWNENYIDSEDDTFLLDLVSTYVSTPVRALRKIFELSHHIGPIRELPQRDHIRCDEKSFLRWLTGIAAYDFLLDIDTPDELVDKMNEWLSSKNHFDSGYKIDIKRFKKMDCDSRLMEIFKTNTVTETDFNEIQSEIDNLPEVKSFNIVDISRGIRLSMQDVGTGISQILPILAGVLGLDTYILSIEQPELHIHPAMQAEMGDLFIHSINQDGPNLIIETHSEHIMLRILRRIRETCEGENTEFKITPDDIAVYSVINDRQITDAILIPVTEEGEFLIPWPNGFFPERAKELFS
jgi:hypothetical protein